MTDQKQTAKQYMVCFPRVAGSVKKVHKVVGFFSGGGLVFPMIEWPGLYAVSHSLLKDVKHI